MYKYYLHQIKIILGKMKKSKTNLLTINDLCIKTGLYRATIQHYLNYLLYRQHIEKITVKNEIPAKFRITAKGHDLYDLL